MLIPPPCGISALFPFFCPTILWDFSLNKKSLHRFPRANQKQKGVVLPINFWVVFRFASSDPKETSRYAAAGSQIE